MKILVPVDSSAASKAAAKLLATKANALWKTACFELLTVLDRLPARVCLNMSDTEQKQYYRDEAEDVFAPLRKLFEKNGIAVKEKFVLGDPAENIVKEALAYKADMIAMGTEGHNALEGAFVGSVAFGVLARCEKPILLLRRGCKINADSLRVGVAVDGSKEAKAAVTRMTELLSFCVKKPEVSVLCAVPDFTKGFFHGIVESLPIKNARERTKAWQKSRSEKRFQDVRPILRKAGIEATEVVLSGAPGIALPKHAEKKLDVLVMGSHGYGRVEAAIVGSVGMQVAANCVVPLLICRK